MKITLISPYPDITAFGIRTISACLKAAGHETQLIFLPAPLAASDVFSKGCYDDAVLADLLPICAGSGVIGITLMTNFYNAAVQITARLKSGLKTPVVWGGVHPTIRPEESLQHADIVCIGDGEDAMVELADRMGAGLSCIDVKNFAFITENGIVKNPVRPLGHDLDVYPAPDYSLDDHHIMHDGRIRPMDRELLKLYLEKGTVSDYVKRTGYQTMTGRGCPHKCTYCINDTLKRMYDNVNYLRWRSPAHVIEELKWVKRELPYVGFIWLSDDSFFARNAKNIAAFCELYKKEIDLPFSCLASPSTVTEEKMDMLVDAGLIYVQMGVESGSKRVQELFNRKHMGNERLMKAFLILNKYKDKMLPPSYDLILDVPYETNADKIETLDLISRIPKPFNIQPFSLVLYPGTKLYEQAKGDGLIGDEKTEIYEKSYSDRDASYLNLLIRVSKSGALHGWLLRLLISPPVAGIFGSALMKPLIKHIYMGLRVLYRLVKGVLKPSHTAARP